jgi:hypothetical protein
MQPSSGWIQLFFKRYNELPVSTKDGGLLGPLTDIHFLNKDSARGASSHQTTHAFECQTPKNVFLSVLAIRLLSVHFCRENVP